MSNNQTKDLSQIPAVKELSNETAANVQGGWALDVYRHSDRTPYDWLGSFNYGSPQLSSNANNQISRIVINSGTWRFFDGFNYTGAYFTRTPGTYNLYSNQWWNDRISSLKKL